MRLSVQQKYHTGGNFMKYTKAEVEVTVFKQKELFMNLSSGKKCELYAEIKTLENESYVCYDVDVGIYITYYDATPITACRDVVSSDTPTPFFCKWITTCYGYNVP